MDFGFQAQVQRDSGCKAERWRKFVERFVQSGSAHLWACASGQGTPLLLCNGGPGCSDYLAPVASMMADRAAAAILRAYAVETCIVGGHSFGSNVALAYALRHPARAMGLIAIAEGQLVNDRSWSEIHCRNRKEVGEEQGGMVFDADARVNAEGNRSWRSFIRRPSLFRDVAALPIFATFATAANDIRPNWPIQRLVALRPNGHCVEIEGAAHYAWLTHAAGLRHELCLAIDRIQSR